MNHNPAHNRCDLTNVRFENLIARYPTGETRNRSRIWHCDCDCGNTVEATARDLNRGAVKSCGCRRRRPPNASHSIENNLHFVDGTCVENLIASQKRRITNRTGVRGVTYHAQSNTYVAYIGFQGKSHYLGRYDSLAAAAAARLQAEHKYFDGFLHDYYETMAPANSSKKQAESDRAKRVQCP